MDKPDGAEQFIMQIQHYWQLLEAKGQGMVVAVSVAFLRCIWDGRKRNFRRHAGETLLAPWAALAVIEVLEAMGANANTAIPVGFTVAIVGMKWLEDRMVAWLDKKLPRE